MTLSKETYRWFYDRIGCRRYNFAIKFFFLPFGGERRCRMELLSPVRFSNEARILDMCCGTGGATLAIARKAPANAEIIGIDLSPGQIAVANSSSECDNIRFMVLDAVSTGFDDDTFDKVFITHALHEMHWDDRLRVLSEAKRVLRADGELVVLEVDKPESLVIQLLAGIYFLYWLPFNFETPTRRDMFRHGVKTEVVDAGFRDVRKTSKYSGVFQVVQGVK